MTKKITIDIDSITARMDELKDTKARLKFELDNVEKEIEKEELKLIALLDQMNVNEMVYGPYKWGWKVTNRKAFDQKLFAIDYPDLLEQYKVSKENKVFQFSINK